MPGPYAHDPILAADPSNPSLVAANASITIFAIGDPTKTPVIIWNLSRTIQLPNPVTTNRLGFGPEFLHDTMPHLAWEGGGFSGTFKSFTGLWEDAQAAVGAAQGAAGSAGEAAANAVDAVAEILSGVVEDSQDAKVAAEAAAALVGAPSDVAVKTLIQSPGSQTAGALSAAYGPEAISNPETPQSNAVQMLISARLESYVPSVDVVRRLVIGDALGTARPEYPGPINWVQSVSPTSIPGGVLDGDEITYVESVPVPFSPADVPGLRMWFDAQSLTATNGEAVATWPDKSGNGFTATQAVGSAQPIYREAGMGGKPSVQFDGVNDSLKFGGITDGNGPWTIYLVGQSNAAGLADGSDSFYGGMDGVNNLRLDYYRTTASAWTAYRSLALTGPAADNAPHRHRTVFNGTSSSIRIDDGVPVTGATANVTTVKADTITLGARPDGFNFLNGHIGEVLFIHATVSEADDAKVQAYLTERWGF